MDTATSREKFKEADALFRAGDYQPALTVLEALNRYHPNQKNILYPAAMCLDKLGRSKEALPICTQLIQSFQDPRASALKLEIENRSQESGSTSGGVLSGLEMESLMGPDILDMPTTNVPYAPVEPEEVPWLKYGLIALAVVVALVIFFVPLMTYEPPPPGSEPEVVAQAPQAATPQAATDVPVDTTMIWVGWAACFLTAVSFQVAGVYLALMLMRSLPFEDAPSNLFNVGLTIFFISLIELSRYAIVLVPFYFSRAYDLGIGGVLFVYVLRIIFGAIGLVLGIAIFIGSIASVFGSATF